MTDENTSLALKMTPLPNQNTPLLPKDKGTYALILRLDAGRVIQVGKLGAFHFPAGHYLYVGSAFGPGGLAGRLGRHLALDPAGRSPHWHIDYLRRWTPIVAVWFAQGQTRREHDWAAQADQLSDAGCPAPRFGSSDCRCATHLFHFAQSPAAGRFSAALTRAFPGDQPLQILKVDAGKGSRQP